MLNYWTGTFAKYLLNTRAKLEDLVEISESMNIYDVVSSIPDDMVEYCRRRIYYISIIMDHFEKTLCFDVCMPNQLSENPTIMRLLKGNVFDVEKHFALKARQLKRQTQGLENGAEGDADATTVLEPATASAPKRRRVSKKGAAAKGLANTTIQNESSLQNDESSLAGFENGESPIVGSANRRKNQMIIGDEDDDDE